MPNSCKIFVNNYAIELSIGIYPHEQTDKQGLIVDTELTLIDAEPIADAIEHTIDYDWVAEQLKIAAHKKHYQLLEAFAQDYASLLLHHPLASSAQITITKPNASTQHEARGITLTKQKST